MMDFIERLRDTVNNLELPLCCRFGVLEGEESLVLNPSAGGGIRKEYFDGMVDQAMQFDFFVKTRSGMDGIVMLNTIAAGLERLTALPSCNQSYEFGEISIHTQPSMLGADEHFVVSTMTIQALLTMHKEEII